MRFCEAAIFTLRNKSDAPLGLLADQSFSESVIESLPGDVFLILTDGLSEVFNRRGAELGLEPISGAFAKHADLPLPDLHAQLRKLVENFGAQSDDQTVLLARHLA